MSRSFYGMDDRVRALKTHAGAWAVTGDDIRCRAREDNRPAITHERRPRGVGAVTGPYDLSRGGK